MSHAGSGKDGMMLREARRRARGFPISLLLIFTFAVGAGLSGWPLGGVANAGKAPKKEPKKESKRDSKEDSAKDSAGRAGQAEESLKKITLSEIAASQDPFSPVVGGTMINGVFSLCAVDAVGGKGKNDQRFFVRVEVAITDSDGEAARLLSGEFEIPTPARPEPTVTVEVPWDGKSDEGRDLPDGEYTYSVFGRYERDDILGNGKLVT